MGSNSKNNNSADSKKRLQDKVARQRVLVTENPHCEIPENYFDSIDKSSPGRIPTLWITPWEKYPMPAFPKTDNGILPQT